MDNIKFKMLNSELVLMTLEVDKIKVHYSGIAVSNPVWVSVNDDSLMPFCDQVQDAWKAWNHNRKYASLLAAYTLR